MTEQNDKTIERELQWFSTYLNMRFESYFKGANGKEEFPAPPDLEKDESKYAQLIRANSFGIIERLTFCLASAPYLQPQLLDLFLTKNPQLDQPFTEFGGVVGKDHRGFLPTGETIMFLTASGGVNNRVNVQKLFNSEHPFTKQNLIYLEKTDSKEPYLSGRLMINEMTLFQLTGNESYRGLIPEVVPAKRISTDLEWKDLVLSPTVMEDLQELMTWIQHESQFMKDPVFKKHVKSGYRTYFHGPSGTGKTIAASLIGKTCSMEVYRIDLSSVVSKYIGETEENLSKIFDYAERQNWILFFDEADALFGKRTEVKSSHDRYANLEVSYLLQRIEDFSGIVIMASNLKSNLDDAFNRRFQSIIYFPMPDARQRLQLWQNIFSGQIKPDPSLDLERLAEEYELSRASIANVFQSSVLLATKEGRKEISKADIMQGIRKEYRKLGKKV